MTHEAYCADILRLTENESFISVGDSQLGPLLNPKYEADTLAGKTLSLPDLLSVNKQNSKVYYRLREVKYKLEDRLVHKAIEQLKSGLLQTRELFPGCEFDRLEIVVPLRQRKLKIDEVRFLGSPISNSRFFLKLQNEEPVFLDSSNSSPITILLL